MFQRTRVRMEEVCGVRTPKTWDVHEDRPGRRGAGFLRIKAVGEGKHRRGCLKEHFRLYYFRGGVIWDLATGAVELERRRQAKMEEVRVVPVVLRPLGMTGGGRMKEEHRRQGLESFS